MTIADEGAGRPTSAAPAASREHPRWSDRLLPGLFVAPGILCLALVTVYPTVFNVAASFTDLSLMYEGFVYVGLDNYRETLGDPQLWRSAVRSAVWTAASVAGQLLVGLVAALALEQVGRGRTALRLSLIVPWAFPAIVLAFGWRFLLDGVYGVVNHWLMLAGVIEHPQAWLSRPDLAMAIMVLINVWFGFPFMMVAIMAGLAAIPRDLFEAARIDGAGWWQEFLHIRLPLLLPVLAILTLLRTIWVFNNFDFVFLTTGGGPVDATTTLPVHAFAVGWQRFDIGRMTAVSVVMSAMLVTGLVLYVRLLGGRAVTREH